jgi:hypothetical protein
MDVVREIASSRTGNVGPYSDVPKETILITDVKINKAPL